MRHVTILVVLLAAWCVAGAAVEVHVSPAGDDVNSGTEAAPLRSLDAARDALRAAAATDEARVVRVHAGQYVLTAGLVLEPEDGGMPDRPVRWEAAGDGAARLIGGQPIPADAFSVATGKRLDAQAVGNVLMARLDALGVGELGEYPVATQDAPRLPELFFDGKRMTLARWPNHGWAEVGEVIESGPAPWRNHASEGLGTIGYSGDRPSRWGNAPGVWLHGYWCFDWRAETIRVREIDTAKRHMIFEQNHCYGIGSGNPGPRRYYALNLLEELDAPGEYYIDREAKTLYFWPPAALDGAEVILSTLRGPAIEIRGAAHLVIEGLTVECCVEDGIHVNGGREVRLEGCEVRNVGVIGVQVRDGRNHEVNGCEIHHTGAAGLMIGGGDRTTLTPCGHVAQDNHIHHVARRQRTGAYQAHLRGVGVRLAHNLIHDSPHQAINIMGNDHIIEFNEIHHTGMETDDCGACYMGRNPSERGSIIRYNYWHHIGSTREHGSCAIYFDDGSGGQRVFGNVFYKAAGGTFGAVFMHGGHDNWVENNVFIECKTAFRQAPWNNAHWRETVEAEDWQNKLLGEVDITQPPYINRYPELEGFMECRGRPRCNYASNNILVKCPQAIRGTWLLGPNYVTDFDPGFVNWGKEDFGLREDSEVWRMLPGFRPIAFDQIGPR